jgi:hypothetical protein
MLDQLAELKALIGLETRFFFMLSMAVTFYVWYRSEIWPVFVAFDNAGVQACEVEFQIMWSIVKFCQLESSLVRLLASSSSSKLSMFRFEL